MKGLWRINRSQLLANAEIILADSNRVDNATKQTGTLSLESKLLEDENTSFVRLGPEGIISYFHSKTFSGSQFY